MYQNTYDMKTSENNIISNLNNENNKEIKYTNSKIGKENPNSLAYKLNQIREAQNKLKLNNDSYAGNHTLANALDNNKITNQNKYSKYKQIPTSNNYINNNNNINTNENHSSSRKSSSRQKQTSSTAQIDEQYEMQKLLELENKNYENKLKDVVYKKIKEKEKEKDKDNILNNSNNNISTKNNIPINNNSYYNNLNKSGYKNNFTVNEKDDNIDKNIKNYIDEQAEKIKEFVHDEINNLHVDLIRQFEIQNSQNMKMFQEFAMINKQLYQEIERLKNENKLLKNNLE
jgi:protein NEDD1